MDLGSFSVSLAVRDINASQAFYEKLGFTAFAGDAAENWLMMRNRDHVIGLFQGMFPDNLLTFNPGWNQHCEPQSNFTDIRELQQRLEDAGLSLQSAVEEGSSGPASLTLTDPDGNVILIDQHC